MYIVVALEVFLDAGHVHCRALLLCSSTGELFQGGSATALLTLKHLPVIIVAMFGVRWLLMTLLSSNDAVHFLAFSCSAA
jgi:hypothetical protein